MEHVNHNYKYAWLWVIFTSSCQILSMAVYTQFLLSINNEITAFQGKIILWELYIKTGNCNCGKEHKYWITYHTFHTMSLLKKHAHKTLEEIFQKVKQVCWKQGNVVPLKYTVCKMCI